MVQPLLPGHKLEHLVLRGRVQKPGDAPAPCQPSTEVLAPNVLILHSFLLCFSKQEAKLHCFTRKNALHIWSYSKDTSLNTCLCTCLGQVIFPLYSLAPLSTKTGTMKFLSSVKYFKICWKQPLCESETWYHRVSVINVLIQAPRPRLTR